MAYKLFWQSRQHLKTLFQWLRSCCGKNWGLYYLLKWLNASSRCGNGSFEISVKSEVKATEKPLDPKDYKEESAIHNVSYNEITKAQTLVFRGVLTEKAKTNLLKKLSQPVSPVLKRLLEDVQKQTQLFLEKHLILKQDTVPISGFLKKKDIDVLFTPPEKKLTQQEQIQLKSTRLKLLVEAFLPVLQQRLIRQFIIETMVAQLGADPV